MYGVGLAVVHLRRKIKQELGRNARPLDRFKETVRRRWMGSRGKRAKGKLQKSGDRDSDRDVWSGGKVTLIERTGDFARHMLRAHHEVANDWAEKVGTGARIK